MRTLARATVMIFVSSLLSLSYLNCSGFKARDAASTTNSLSATLPVTVPVGVADNSGEALAALSGAPLIHQIRNGVEIATFANLSSVFSRSGFRLYQTGDVFELDPAIYSGVDQQAWIGTQAANAAEWQTPATKWMVPTDLILRGRVVNGYRPVIRLDSNGAGSNTLGQGMLYIDHSKNLKIENIDFDGAGYGVGKGGIYINGADGLTLRHSRVMNFNESNGVFSTGNNAGTILFENVETAFNGGDSGPEHNYYMGRSDSDTYFDEEWPHRADANHLIIWRGCYSHDAFYGHTLKSRAQNNLVEGSYLRGKEIVQGAQQGEAYLADFPNGGHVTVRDTILEKGYSGDNSNGLFITYAMEGQAYPDASSIHIAHNTLVARTKTYDSLGHRLQPFAFYYPNQSPADTGFPVSDVVVDGNLFLGFETDPSLVGAVALYRGIDQLALSDLAKIDLNFNLLSPQAASLSSVGELAPALLLGTTTRTQSTFGARD